MYNDFDQIDHKNIELLRYYVNRDVKDISRQIRHNDANLLSYFLASLVDICVVVFIDQGVVAYLENKYNTVLLKILLVIALIGFFLVVSWIVKKIYNALVDLDRESGKVLYDEKTYYKQDVIDQFDNIACDGLLIADIYKQRYQASTNAGDDDREEMFTEFYLYEIVHHVQKAAAIFSIIYDNKHSFVDQSFSQLLDVYRFDNFIDISKKMVEFLNSIQLDNDRDRDLLADIRALSGTVDSWVHFNSKSIHASHDSGFRRTD